VRDKLAKIVCTPIYEKPKCVICQGPDAIQVQEQWAGSKGFGRRSFSGHYALCSQCIALCSANDAVVKEIPWRFSAKEILVVKGKTYAWLRNMLDQGKIVKRGTF
jgi:hypothetical protein